MDFDINVLIFTVSLFLGWFLFRKSKYDEFSLEAQGVPHEKPLPFVGNMLPLVTGKEGGTQFFFRLYNTFKPEK
jgi:hypothetical protein